MERTLADGSVKARASKLFVGLAADCDSPQTESEIKSLWRDHLDNPQILPFVAVLTPDLKWVHGFSGHRDAATWGADLDTIEASPLLDATPQDAKKLEKIADGAEKALAKESWTKVFEAADEAAELAGRHPARERIAAAVAQARGVAEAGLSKVLADLQGGADRAEARKALFALQKAFKGQPEADEAAAGVKAAEKLGRLEGVAEEFRESARAKAAEEFAGTRWTTLFGGVYPAPKQAEDEAK